MSKKLTQSQQTLINEVQAGGRVAVAKYDKRVVNALVKKKLIALDGDHVSLAVFGKNNMDKPTNGTTTKKPAIASEVNCLCGCGQTPANAKSAFAQGHDMKLRSAFQKAYRADPDQMPEFSDLQMSWIQGASWYAEFMAKFSH